MKSFPWYGIAVGFIALMTNTTLSQIEDPVCADPLEKYAYTGTVQRGGLHMTSIGVIRVLVVFVQFLDDSLYPESSYWPPSEPPIYFDSYIDPDPNSPSYEGNLSHFYRQMSFDRFVLWGDPYFIITEHPESYYRTLAGNYAFSEANKEVLQRLDSVVDYTVYDNWTFTPYDYNGHHEGADGIADLIIMHYRKPCSTPSTQAALHCWERHQISCWMV